ncbi:hypothetical protein AB0N28_11335, partial [Streptomyces sp. NPDC051130]|uniref:hypothetical protein n=1 Tax=Streptomyces sp. NPDC051130 TaxID=3157223 RepID=UPI0034452DFE
ASRDAENREEFVQGVLDILGVEPEVITGEQGGGTAKRWAGQCTSLGESRDEGSVKIDSAEVTTA